MSITTFYDGMAGQYRFIFADWKKSVMRQGKVLNTLIRSLSEGYTLLDCTCGVGTQALGLATYGYAVHGTDLSPAAIKQARQYAPEFETPVAPTFAVADLLQPPANPDQYDIVISCDNAVAHFLTDDQLNQAIDTMLLQLKPGGLLLISLRDYDRILAVPPRTSTPTISDDADGRHIVFQVWDWADDMGSYQLEMVFMHRQKAVWAVESYTTQLRALKKEELTAILESKNLLDIDWHMPSDKGYYQPIVTARKADQ